MSTSALFPFGEDNPFGLQFVTDPVEVAQLEALNSVLCSDADAVARLRAWVAFSRQRKECTILLKLQTAEELLQRLDAPAAE